METIHRAKDIFKNKPFFQFLGAVVGHGGKTLEDAFMVISDEWSSDGRLPFRKRLRAWRRGFVTETYLLFQFGQNDPSEYLSNTAHRFGASKINKHKSGILVDKVAFYKTFNSFGNHLPEIYGTYKDGSYFPMDNQYSSVTEIPGDLVVKPIVGAEGDGVHVLHQTDDGYLFDGDNLTAEAVEDELSNLDDYLVSEFVHQASYADQIFPDASNTIRIISMIDPDDRDPFIATAAHRFGTKRTSPVDNFSRGGVCADIDIESGTIGQVAIRTGNGNISFSDRHPDTDERAAGTDIENWEEVVSAVLELHSTVSHIKYIGWDVLVTDDGFKVIEGNHNPGILTSQIHGGLLEDGQVRRFYESHGVI